MSHPTHPALARAPRGVMSALPTPFDAHGEVDHAALAALTRWQRAEGVAGGGGVWHDGGGAHLERARARGGHRDLPRCCW